LGRVIAWFGLSGSCGFLLRAESLWDVGASFVWGGLGGLQGAIAGDGLIGRPARGCF